MKVKVPIPQSYLTLCDPMDCMQPTRLLWPWNSPGKNNGVFLVAIPLSRGSSRPRDQTWASCIGRQILYHLTPPGKHGGHETMEKWEPVLAPPHGSGSRLPGECLLCCARTVTRVWSPSKHDIVISVMFYLWEVVAQRGCVNKQRWLLLSHSRPEVINTQ